ncbi:MAG: glycosyltransferase family 1 protein [Trichloromonadaceae bacterium]
MLRVLHVIKWLGHGGVEVWLVNVLRKIDQKEIAMDFLVQDDSPSPLYDEVISLGSKVHLCTGAPNPLKFAKQIYSVIKRNGPYHVVHCHLHHFSGFVLTISKMCGVPQRIAHSHSDISRELKSTTFGRSLYYSTMKIFIHLCATQGFGVSNSAGKCLFGRKWGIDKRWRVLPGAINLDQFTECPENKDLRKDLGFPENAFVIGHVGRFAKPKNHKFLIRMLSGVIKRKVNCYLLLIGEGPLRGEIELIVRESGIEDKVVFTGLRQDVPSLMKNAIDLFVFPSLYEGLGLVLLEAQAAGLQCLVSTEIPEEVFVIPELVHALSLDSPKEEWQKYILECIESIPNVRCVDPIKLLKDAPLAFTLDKNIKELIETYQRNSN